jgi:hypothetical protein
VRYLMSFWLGFVLAAGLWLGSGWRGASSPAAFTDVAAVETWMAHYHLTPEPARLIQAVDTLVALGALDQQARLQPAAAFLAALIAEDDGLTAVLSERIAEAAPAKQRLLAQAIALSGLPQWRRLLTLLKRQVPARALEIETLLAEPDTRATLQLAFDEAGVVLDMVVAHFMATGSEAAALRLVAALAGSLDNSDPLAASTGDKAKAALALRAASDPRLLDFTRRAAGAQPEPLAGLLRDVVAAATAAAR